MHARVAAVALLLFAAAASRSLAAAPVGDTARGQLLWERLCTGCHTLDRNQVGPRHRGVFGRRAGSLPDYDYSPALKRAKFTWSEKMLDAWLTNPEALVPGQKMGFSVALPQDRADIIAYLKSLSAP